MGRGRRAPLPPPERVAVPAASAAAVSISTAVLVTAVVLASATALVPPAATAVVLAAAATAMRVRYVETAWRGLVRKAPVMGGLVAVERGVVAPVAPAPLAVLAVQPGMTTLV